MPTNKSIDINALVQEVRVYNFDITIQRNTCIATCNGTTISYTGTDEDD